MSNANWKQFFRHDTFRPGQDTATDAIIKHFDNGKQFVIAELPTGIGKSDIAVCLAQLYGKAYITTPQNMLIDQYVKDFGHEPWFSHMKGRRHYPCLGGYENCEVGKLSKCSCTKKRGETPPCCTYSEQKRQAMATDVTLTNTAYYATALRMGDWPVRPITVIDEAHNLPDNILDQTSFIITDSFLASMMVTKRIHKNFKIGKHLENTKEFDTFLQELASEIEYNIETMEEDVLNSFSYAKELKKMKELFDKIQNYFASCESTRWVVDVEESGTQKNPEFMKISGRPLDSAYFAKEMMFSQAERFLLQSATIVDIKRFAGELGISGLGSAVKRPSPFDLTRRPIYSMDTANLIDKTYDMAMPKILEQIEDIIYKYKGQKGLVHTSSYKVQKYIEANIDQTGIEGRLKFLNPKTKKEEIEKYLSSCDDDTVLFSPSMTEGFDGRGDFLRFQIVCKVPYLYWGDRRVSTKAKEDRGWYDYQAAKTLIQMIGRGMRSDNDWCHNYILDSQFEKIRRSYSLGDDINKTVLDRHAGMTTLLNM